MSRENVDRLIEAMDAFNRIGGTPEAFDRRALRGLLGVMDPEIQFEPQQAALQGSYVGHEGVRQWLADLAEHYGAGHLECADIRDLGDRVLALGTLRVRGRGSGIEMEVPAAIVASFRNGLMTEFKDYGPRDRALVAVGLSE
jgi:ketosteroid isomerase-like protein